MASRSQNLFRRKVLKEDRDIHLLTRIWSVYEELSKQQNTRETMNDKACHAKNDNLRSSTKFMRILGVEASCLWNLCNSILFNRECLQMNHKEDMWCVDIPHREHVGQTLFVRFGGKNKLWQLIKTIASSCIETMGFISLQSVNRLVVNESRSTRGWLESEANKDVAQHVVCRHSVLFIL